MKTLSAIALACVLATPANAFITACFPRDKMVDLLKRNYDEDVRLVAFASDGTLWEWVANSSTGTWTVIVTRPDKIACVLGEGTAWDEITISDLGPES